MISHQLSDPCTCGHPARDHATLVSENLASLLRGTGRCTARTDPPAGSPTRGWCNCTGFEDAG